MTVRDWAVIFAAMFWGVLVVALCVLVARVAKVLDESVKTIKTVTDETVPILRGVNETVAGVNVELARVDTILAGVQSITATTDRLVGVVHTTVSNPLIKAAAFVTGAMRGSRKSQDGDK
ncbi:MAG: DUF948 domain-containing protein [Nitriliruptoraceae bacterium]